MAEETTTKETATKKLRASGELDRPTVKALQKEMVLKETGIFDRDLVTALQDVLGVEQTGYVHNQNLLAQVVGTDIAPTVWRYAGMGGEGDDMVRAMQVKLGVDTTGQLDDATVKALQGALNEGLKWA